MIEQEKQLLLADLCARLPYKIFAQWHHKALNKFRNVKIMKISIYGKNIDDYYINVLCQPEPGVDYEASIVEIKPYLRPMSSMSDGEKKEFHHVASLQRNYLGDDMFYTHWQMYDWLNAHHFDYRGLITKGLAFEAPEGMYNT
jgi:hypothetical protein